MQGQLALGTIQLAENELAVDEAQAAILLPLWQALQSLTASNTTAAIEISAVVNQIQDNMTVEQIQAITTISLTSEDIADLMPDDLSGGIDVTSGKSDSSNVMAGPADGGPSAGGDFAGDDPGGMPTDMGGMAGAAVSSEEVSDPSQASGGLENMQETMLTHAVISLLAETVSVMEN